MTYLNHQQNSPGHKRYDKNSNSTEYNDAREKILDLDIVSIAEKYTTIKRAGVNYQGLCPIHKEKTPSFIVSPAKNIWKCFGCGKGGNLIDLVMEVEGMNFREALARLAHDNNIELPHREQTQEEREKELHSESLLVVNSIAAKYFEENLLKRENKIALNYLKERWSEETIRLFGLGYASDSWNDLMNYFGQKGVKKGIAQEAGLLKENKGGGLYDFFRGRIIFPIHDRHGRIIGFSGRVMPGNSSEAKYINTPETAVYRKGEVLYGLNTALRTIKEKKFVYLVEGNPDVIKLQGIGIENTVGTCGTSLTPEQILILNPLVKSVNIIGDSDKAGQKAVDRSAKMLIEAGITVCVVTFPEGEEKQDPDSFFTDEEHFKKYVNANIPDYIIMKGKKLANKAHSPDFKAKAIDELASLIVKFDDRSLHELYVDQLSKIIPPKKAWTDKIKLLLKDADPLEKREMIPGEVDINDFERYGFYPDKDGYHFRVKSGIVRGCNFTMKPLFHIQSVLNAKRLYEIKNEFGHTERIELLQKDLVSLPSFKVRIESLGNFLWEASESELNKLKRFLYEKTETCIEITQLGWQKGPKFFAWANGIYNGTFASADENGIVKHEGKNYYLPAFSSFYKGEEGLFVNERRLVHRDNNNITLYDYSRRLMDVYGDNAMIALCFYFATLFSDYIVGMFNFFPILNLFGPKGAGKTELAVSMLHFFGKGGKGPNINNTTKAALADHVAQICNGCIHIDEYKNNIDFEKIEFLKGLWDRTGRTRMNMDKDKKKETTAVDCGVILSGQEMPTADIALFSRLIYLSFFKTEYSEEEKKKFNELKEIEKKGLTHITHEILGLREQFKKRYQEAYDLTIIELSSFLGNEVIEDRLLRNWGVILAAYASLEDDLRLPWGHKKLFESAVSQLKIQQRETRTSNEISTFWNLVQFMYADGLISDGVDFKIYFGLNEIKTDIIERKFQGPTDVLYIQYSRIIPLYRKIGKTNNEKILPADSIDYYLKHDKRYLGKKLIGFKAIDPKTGLNITDNEGKAKRKVTNAYAFFYKLLEITLHSDDYKEEDDNKDDKTKPLNGSKDEEELPF